RRPVLANPARRLVRPPHLAKPGRRLAGGRHSFFRRDRRSTRDRAPSRHRRDGPPIQSQGLKRRRAFATPALLWGATRKDPGRGGLRSVPLPRDPTADNWLGTAHSGRVREPPPRLRRSRRSGPPRTI